MSNDAFLAALLAGAAGYMIGRADCNPPARCPGRVKFASAAFSSSASPIVKGDLMSFVLRIDQRVTVSIQPVDRAGNPAAIDGVPVWAAATGAVALTPAEDGLSCVIEPVGQLGTEQVSVTCDADLGAGVRTIAGVLDIDIVAGEAVGIVINPGVPENV
jgi:hypothetical protein